MGHDMRDCIELSVPPTRWGCVRGCLAALVVFLLAMPFDGAAGQTRIKDVADVEGVRDNQLVGYGIVAGLNGTGDKLQNAVFTRESLIAMLERLGVNTRDQITRLDTKNIAAVMVTAIMPPFVKAGEHIDVTVAALGDATNLTGGTLLVTSLLGADGEVHAVAQGIIATGAIAVKGQAQSVTQGVPTSGRIANGATVEKEIPFELAKMTTPRLGLRNPDLTTAMRIAASVNKEMGGNIARASDPRTVALNLQGRDVIEAL